MPSRDEALTSLPLSKRTSLGLLTTVGTLLAAVLLFDVYQDWRLEGGRLWSTLLENGIPFLFAISVPLLGWRWAQFRQGEAYASEAATWAVLGGGCTALVCAIVFGFQIMQGRIKPGVILAQLSTVGALAGVFVGYGFARVKTMRDDVREKEARLQGLADTIPGIVYQIAVGPDETFEVQFVSDHATSRLGISSAPGDFRKQFLESVSSPDPETLRTTMEAAADEEEAWRREVRFEKPSGEQVWLLDAATPHRQDGTLFFSGVLLDITERKRSEEELQDYREYTDRILDAIDDVFFVHDQEGRLQRWNESLSDVSGYPDEAISSMRGIDFVPEEDRDRTAAAIAECLETGHARLEVPLLTKEGFSIPYEFVAARVEHPDGDPRVVGIGRDISERKEKERELRQSRARLEALFEGSPDMIALHDAGGTILDANLRLCEEIGYAKEALVGMRVWEIDQTVDPDEARRHWSRMEVGQSRRLEGVYCRKNRSTFPVEVHIRRLDLEGKALFVTISRDTTEQNRREKRLRERQRKVEALYEATNRLLRADDEATVVDLLVTLVDERLGYPATTIRMARGDRLEPVQVPSVVQSHMPERPAYAVNGDTPAAAAYRSGDTRVFDDLSAVDQSLERGDIRATAYVPMGRHGLISVGSLEVGGIGSFDLRLLEVLATYASVVLERLTREDELRKAKEEAERSSRTKSAFLANMSHEIRTPLTSIIGFAEVLGAEAKTLEAAASLEEYADMIEQSGKRLLETLDGVLNLSRLQSGGMDLELTPVPLGEEVRRVMKELRPKAEDKGIEVHEEGTPVTAAADNGGVQIVTRNLISNAIKYTEEGGEVSVRTYADGEETAVLEVKDTGIGMEPSTAETLFEPFRQASEGLGREYEGTGIGLAVTREATQQMGGTIEVDTEKGEGSCFTVRLPRASDGEGASGT